MKIWLENTLLNSVQYNVLVLSVLSHRQPLKIFVKSLHLLIIKLKPLVKPNQENAFCPLSISQIQAMLDVIGSLYHLLL